MRPQGTRRGARTRALAGGFRQSACRNTRLDPKGERPRLGVRPGEIRDPHFVRALVVHRDPTVASQLVAALEGANGPIEAVILHDPSGLATALGEGGFDVVVHDFADTVVRERDSGEHRRAATRARALLDAQRALADRLVAEPSPQELLSDALELLAEVFGADGGIAWEGGRGELERRRVLGGGAGRRRPRRARLQHVLDARRAAARSRSRSSPAATARA